MRLLRTYTVFLTAFARKVTYCVRVCTALCVKQLMGSKRLVQTKYGFARKATYVLDETYAYKVRLSSVKRLMLEGLTV